MNVQLKHMMCDVLYDTRVKNVIKDQITLNMQSINVTGGTFVHNVERTLSER